MGVFSSINYYRTDRAYHNVAQAYQVSAADVLQHLDPDAARPDRERVMETQIHRQRRLQVVSDATVVSVAGPVQRRPAIPRGLSLDHRPGARTNITPDSATSLNGRIDVDRQYREPETINYQISVNVEHTADLWKFDGAVGFNRITNTYSETMTPLMSFNGVNLAYDRSVRDFPVFTITNGVNIDDPARSHAQHDHAEPIRLGQPRLQLQRQRQARSAESAVQGLRETGFRARIDDWKQIVAEPGRLELHRAAHPAQFTTVYCNDRFLRQSDGRERMPTTFFPTSTNSSMRSTSGPANSRGSVNCLRTAARARQEGFRRKRLCDLPHGQRAHR